MALNREQIIRNAEKYVSRGKLEAAIKEYRKVLAENPNDANTLNRVGDLYARIEKFGEAVKLFSQIAEQYTRDGFFVKAIAIYKKIIKLEPSTLTVYERLAELYHRQGLLNEARTQYQVLADYYTKHDNAASAITIYQKMSQMEPENPTFHLRLAELYQEQRLDDKALSEYRSLADLMLVNGSVEDAIQVYLKALDLGNENLDFVREAVSSLHDGGHVGAAAKVLAKAVELNPEASGIAVDVGLEEAGGTGEAAGAAEVEVGDEAVAAEADEEVEADDTFDVAESPFDDVEAPDFEAFGEAFGGGAAAAMLEEDSAGAEDDAGADEGTVFTLDLDEDDEDSEFLVKPPPDMVGEEAAEEEAVDEEAPSTEATAEESLDEVEIEVPIELEDTAMEVEELAADDAAAGEVEVEWSMEPMDELDVELEGSAAAVEPFAPEAFEEVEEESEATAQPAVRREEDLLAEAQVFTKYGLHEKAQDRLSELLELSPEHLDGLQLQVRLHLEAGRHEEAMECANRVAQAAANAGQPEVWQELRDQLAKAGYAVEDDQVVHEPGEKGEEDDRIAQLLEDLSLEGFEAPAPPREGRRKPADEEPAAAAVGAEAAAPVEPEPAAEEEGKELVSLADELGLDELDEEMEGALAGSPEAQEVVPAGAGTTGDSTGSMAAVGDGGDALDETGMSWLDDVDTGERPAVAQAEAIFDEEDDFFDLAAELERELSQEELEADEGIAAQPQEQSLEDIIEGFKQGVAENLAPEDFDTHFNLGIAYREMGLLDEAIGEFQLASKDPRYIVDCSSLLGICFLDKGLPELAIRWYRKGLEAPDIGEEKTLGLLYDMGNAYLASGDSDAAYKTFVEIYGLNSNYRDVATKLQELRAS
jgi:tetratricopeptide (TPR) repeat protein